MKTCSHGIGGRCPLCEKEKKSERREMRLNLREMEAGGWAVAEGWGWKPEPADRAENRALAEMGY